MQKIIILVVALISVSLAYTEKEYQDAFLDFSHKYQKTFHHDEFQSRYQIFKHNMDVVRDNNAQNNGMILAINKFADLSSQEFNKLFKGLKKVTISAANNVEYEGQVSAPDNFSWVTQGAVTGIKNQQQCGSCWSFSTTGSMEGCHYLNSNPKQLVGLSEQNLMDCSDSYGNEGCNGGLMIDAMEYIIANGGIDTEASYPYTAEDGTSCKYTAANSGATEKSYVNVAQGSESGLLAQAVIAPVSVAIDASQNSFQLYSSGIYYEPACSSTQLDHGVLVAGWGVDSTKKDNNKYWIVKNSWGTDWGLQGYIWMSRDRNNNCGIATMATRPTC